MLTNRPEFHIQEVGASHLGATTYSIYNTSSASAGALPARECRHQGGSHRTAIPDVTKAAGGPVEHILVVDAGDLDRLEPAFGIRFRKHMARRTTRRRVVPDLHVGYHWFAERRRAHTYRSMLACTSAMISVLDHRPGDRALSFLTSAHIGDRAANHYLPVIHGAQVTSLADPAQLATALVDTRPTVWAAVPRVWEKLKTGIDLQLQANEALRAGFDAGAPEVKSTPFGPESGLATCDGHLDRSGPDRPRRLCVLRQARHPRQGEVWGMSEAGSPPAPRPRRPRRHRRPLLSGVDGKLADDGELLVRGAALMKGYRNDPVKTAEAIDAGRLAAHRGCCDHRRRRLRPDR